MQRWFFLEDRHRKKKVKSVPLDRDMSSKDIPKEPEVSSQLWTFTVRAPNLEPKEIVYITGSTAELGEWDYNRSVPLEHGGTDSWSKSIIIPNTCNVYYRYAICRVVEDTNALLVSSWETNIKPRVIKESMLHPITDTFGLIEDKPRISRGWLTAQTLVQFKFIKNPLKLKSKKAVDKHMYIKVTPVKLSFGTETANVEDTSMSTDTLEAEAPCDVIVEVSTLSNNPDLCKLKQQEQFGREYNPDDVLLVNVYALDTQNLAYLVDCYSYSSRASPEDCPYHVGYTYVLPNMFKPSEGHLELPVICNVKHRPLGTINIEYVIVRPMEENINDFQVSYAKHWNSSWTGLEVGHRGLGASFKTKEGNAIRENTIASLKKAAAGGADLLEFDVQLSKDMIPVIYHDYHVCISMKRKKEVELCEMLELPVKDLTLEHLQKLKVYHLVEGRSNETLFFDDDLEEHQPFPTLERLLQSITIHAGFNVELKWNMELEDGTCELDNPFDMNTYIDKVLEVVLKHAGERRIVFSCFNPDICTMTRNKQNKYPVMFLTQGVTSKYKPYRDPRCSSIPAAVRSAVSCDILGIVVHTEDLLRDPSQVKLATNAGLVIFCWGDDNNDKDTIMMLKHMGLHAVIYDKIDQYSTKEIKESIFLVEARESERELMRLAFAPEVEPEAGSGAAVTKADSGTKVDSAAAGTKSDSGTKADSKEESQQDVQASIRSVPPLESPAPAPPPFLDLTRRYKLLSSTATSLDSLATSIDLRDEPSTVKRSSDILANIDKESQLKEQRCSFGGLFPAGDTSKGSPKKSRNH